MAFTKTDRDRLAIARRTVEKLEAKEQEAFEHVVDVLNRAGFDPRGHTWPEGLRQHADAIRDALEPFDSGVRECAAPKDDIPF